MDLIDLMLEYLLQLENQSKQMRYLKKYNESDT